MKPWRTLLVLILLLGACEGGREKAAEVREAQIEPVTIELPDQILGLKVTEEDVSSSLEALKGRTYLESLGLFSMREGDLLRATLQVGRFNSLARARSKEFRREIAGLAGAPEELRLGTAEVSQISGNQQTSYIWFESNGFFVLTVHRDFPFGRTLLRKLIEMDPEL